MAKKKTKTQGRQQRRRTTSAAAKPSATKKTATRPAPPLLGVTVCFSGTRNLVDRVEAVGGIIRDSVTKDRDLVVIKNAGAATAKSRKAAKYGIKTVTLDQLERMLDGRLRLPASVVMAQLKNLRDLDLSGIGRLPGRRKSTSDIAQGLRHLAKLKHLDTISVPTIKRRQDLLALKGMKTLKRCSAELDTREARAGMELLKKAIPGLGLE